MWINQKVSIGNVSRAPPPCCREDRGRGSGETGAPARGLFGWIQPHVLSVLGRSGVVGRFLSLMGEGSRRETSWEAAGRVRAAAG